LVFGGRTAKNLVNVAPHNVLPRERFGEGRADFYVLLDLNRPAVKRDDCAFGQDNRSNAVVAKIVTYSNIHSLPQYIFKSSKLMLLGYEAFVITQ
jgi:hypothetical protein